MGPVAGVLAVDECCEAKTAGWKRGSECSFGAPGRRGAVLALRGCSPPRAAGGSIMPSCLTGDSKRGERGVVGRSAGDERGEGILARGERGLRDGDGDIPREGAVVGRALRESLSILSANLVLPGADAVPQRRSMVVRSYLRLGFTAGKRRASLCAIIVA